MIVFKPPEKGVGVLMAGGKDRRGGTRDSVKTAKWAETETEAFRILYLL